MTTGQRVQIEGRRNQMTIYTFGRVTTICPTRGVLVAFDHGGGAWMNQSELMPAEEEG